MYKLSFVLGSIINFISTPRNYYITNKNKKKDYSFYCDNAFTLITALTAPAPQLL